MRRRGALCDSTETARQLWRSFRSSASATPLVSEMERMAGPRNRCFYCSDSRAADVDHYNPISRDYTATWHWPNLLWVCPECNRKKNLQFPTADDQPLLIDPTAVDPWSRVTLDVGTGMLAARFRGEVPDRSGEATLEVLDILNQESVAEGRKNSMRRLRTAAEEALAIDDRPSYLHGLWHAIREDDFGVAAWFALWEGAEADPFSALRSNRPRVWRHFVRCVVSRGRP